MEIRRSLHEVYPATRIPMNCCNSYSIDIILSEADGIENSHLKNFWTENERGPLKAHVNVLKQKRIERIYLNKKCMASVDVPRRTNCEGYIEKSDSYMSPRSLAFMTN